MKNNGHRFLKKGTGRIRIYRSLILILIILISCESAYSGVRCASDIVPVETPGVAYGPRGNRCEGFYHSKVAAGSIDVVGVVQGAFQFKLDPKEVLEVSSPIIRDEMIHVRAVGIPVKTYYRMDAELRPGQKLIWPVADVILPQKLSPNKIGVFGWTEKQDKTFYVPVRAISALYAGVSDETIHLFLRTSADVENVKWRVSDFVKDRCSPPSKKWYDTGRKHYRAGQPIHISLPSTRAEGLCVEVAAKDESSARWLKQNVHIIVGEDENGQ